MWYLILTLFGYSSTSEHNKEVRKSIVSAVMSQSDLSHSEKVVICEFKHYCTLSFILSINQLLWQDVIKIYADSGMSENLEKKIILKNSTSRGNIVHGDKGWHINLHIITIIFDIELCRHLREELMLILRKSNRSTGGSYLTSTWQNSLMMQMMTVQ